MFVFLPASCHCTRVERMQTAFMKLVQLDDMNGAILYVPRDQMNFCKMEKVNLGENWPVTEKAATSSDSI